MKNTALDKILGLSNKESQEQLTKIDNNLQQLLGIEELSSNMKEDELAKDKKQENLLVREEKRRQSDQKKANAAKSLFRKDREDKKDTNWMMMALGGAVLGGIALWSNKDKVGKMLKSWAKDQAIPWVTDNLKKLFENIGNELKKAVGIAPKSSAPEQTTAKKKAPQEKTPANVISGDQHARPGGDLGLEGNLKDIVSGDIANIPHGDFDEEFLGTLQELYKISKDRRELTDKINELGEDKLEKKEKLKKEQTELEKEANKLLTENKKLQQEATKQRDIRLKTTDTKPKGYQNGGVIINNHVYQINYQTGGAIRKVPGSSTGDKHFAWQRPGDVVVNRNAAPMFLQEGGVVEYLTGDPTHGGYDKHHDYGNYHEHVAFSSTSARDEAMKYLKAQGWTIGSVNTGKHAEGSYHYTNQAFDVPFYPNNSTKGYSDNRSGTNQFSADVRAALKEGGYDVGGASSSLKGGGMDYTGPDIGPSSTLGMFSPSLMTSGEGISGMLLNLFMGGIGGGMDMFSGGGGLGGMFGGGTPTESSAPSTGGTGTAKSMYEYLKGKGLASNNAKGIIANIERESTFNPAAVGDKHAGGSYGLFQWNHNAGRSGPMMEAVPDWKTNWKKQIDYALNEPGEPGQEYSSMEFSSAQEAADWWMTHWERPGDTAAGSSKHAGYLSGYDFQQGGIAQMQGVQGNINMHDKFLNQLAKNSSRQVIVVKRPARPSMIPVDTPMGNSSSGSEINTLITAQQMHRIQGTRR